MAKKLIIAEKRDAGQTIANVVSNVWGEHFVAQKGYLESERYIVSWCAGHLVTLAQPDAYDPNLKKWSVDTLPIIPNQMQYTLIESTQGQYFILEKLFARKDVIGIVNAADAGREGELIFRLVYMYAKCKKPVKRLWASTTAAEDIKNALLSMKPGSEFDSLYLAALCRSIQDWLIGINATRKYSCEYGQKLTIGRVQTPTLAMVVNRDRAIEGFQKSYLYKLMFCDEKGTKFLTEAFESVDDANAALRKCSGKSIAVQDVKTQTKRVKPPMLYSTTELQKDTSKYFGMSPKETLDIMQKLYDQHLLSYPRTDATSISSAQEKEFHNFLKEIISWYQWPAPTTGNWNVSRLVDDKAITDHPALTITREFSPSKRNGCNDKEKAVLDLVVNRMVTCASGDYVYKATAVFAQCNGVVFESRGIETLDEGWRYYRKMIAPFAPDTVLPDYQKGETLIAKTPMHIEQIETKPPARFTPSTLLEAMEKAGKNDMDSDVERVGIGTSATRAEIIEKLVSTGYVEITGAKNTIRSTEKGRALIDVMPSSLRNVDMTVEWENKMLAIRTAPVEKAEILAEDLLNETKQFVKDLISNFTIDNSLKCATGSIQNNKKESVGNCPACGRPVYLSKAGTSWYCSGYKEGCTFSIWKDGQKGIYPLLKANKYALTNKRIQTILKNGKTSLVSLTSPKTGKQMKASIALQEYAPGKYTLGLEF